MSQVGKVGNKDTLDLWEQVLGPAKDNKVRSQERDNKLREELFLELDRDEDEKITQAEFGLDKTAWDKWDLNGDGSLTKSEFKRAIKLFRKELELNLTRETDLESSDEKMSILKLLDGDKNEEVSPEELTLAQPKDWHLQRANGGYKLNGKIFSKKLQALAYAFAQNSKMLQDTVTNIAGSEELATKLMTDEKKSLLG